MITRLALLEEKLSNKTTVLRIFSETVYNKVRLYWNLEIWNQRLTLMGIELNNLLCSIKCQISRRRKAGGWDLMHCPDAPSGQNGILLQLSGCCRQGPRQFIPVAIVSGQKILVIQYHVPFLGERSIQYAVHMWSKAWISHPLSVLFWRVCWNFTRRPLFLFFIFFYSSIYYYWVHVCLVYLRLWVPETSEENFLGLVLSFHCGFQKPNSCFQSWVTSALTWCAMSWASTEVYLGFNPLLGSVLSSPPVHRSPRPHFIFLLFSISSRACFTGNPTGNRENASSDSIEVRLSKPWPGAVFTLCRYGLLGHSHTFSFAYPL